MLDMPTLAHSFGSTSSSLLVRAKAHEPEAWERLVKLYSTLVYHWCRGAGLQPDDAADLAQEVFLAVFNAIGRFRHDGPGNTFRGWLRTITRNKLRDYLRKRTRSVGADGGLAADALLRELIEPPADDDSLASEQFDKQLLFQQSLELLRAEFADPTWQAFWRVTIDGHAAGDVAADLGVSLNSVYKAKSRVLSRLRADLAELLQ